MTNCFKRFRFTQKKFYFQFSCLIGHTLKVCIIFNIHNVFKNTPFRGKIEFIFEENKYSSLCIKRNRHYFNLKLKYKVLYINLLYEVAGSLKITISMQIQCNYLKT